jgi:SAM-dependent methyltransferase
MTPPEITDAKALSRQRARALRAPVDFLHEAAIVEVQERLSLVNKSFTAPAIVTWRPDLWANALPGAVIVPDHDTLDLTPGAHDLVVHALALHWANDPVGQIIQARRALRPDGLFLGIMFGGETLSELRAVLGEAEAEVTAGLSPRVLPMGEVRDLGAVLQRSGLALPVADTQRLDVTYTDLFALMADLRAMGETNALATRIRRPTSGRVFRRAAEIYAQAFPAEEGRIRATFEFVVLTGWAPDESQPKPLKPGSAAARLADALGAVERKL